MKFIRSRLLTVSIIVMSLLALIAVIIGIRVSITMLERHNQMLERLPSEKGVASQGANKPSSIGLLKEQVFYFNGENISVPAYSTIMDEVYIPIDSILMKLGTSLKYFSSDDIAETSINGKKLILYMGKNVIKYGDKEIKLPSIPIAAKNHILVPAEIIRNFQGFIWSWTKDKGTVFVDYWPEIRKESTGSIKLLGIRDKTAETLDVTGINSLNYKNNQGNAERIQVSPDNSKFIIIYKDSVYLGNNEKGSVPLVIDVDVSATWSADSEYLYWIDDKKKTSFVYDVENKKVEPLGDYYFNAVTRSEDGLTMFKGRMLYVYKKGPGFRRIVLTNASYDNKYIFIERKGKLVANGLFTYSPDKTRILYTKSDKYYYISNLDGTRQFCLGLFDSAQWVDNDKIFIRDGDKSYIYSRNEKKKDEVSENWEKVGQTASGDVFFMMGNVLFCETDGVEKKVMTITGGCDFVYPVSPKGPYLIASQKEDNILYLNNENVNYLGKYSSLTENYKDGEIFTDIEHNIIASPDKRTIAVFQKNKDFISINVIDSSGKKPRNICLNYPVNNDTDIYSFAPVWINNEDLLVYSNFKSWLINIKGNTKIFEHAEAGGDSIQGILR